MKKILALFAIFIMFGIDSSAYFGGGTATGVGILTKDGAVTTATVVGSTVVPVLTTTLKNDVIVIVSKSTNSTHVTGISDVAGLTWSRRTPSGGITWNGGAGTVEIWSAIATNVLSSDSITITYNATPTPRVVAFGVNGANTTNPFDSNVVLPASNTGSSSSLAATVSTTNANTLIFGLAASTGTSTFGEPSGFSPVLTINTNMDLSYAVVSSAQSSVAETYTGLLGNSVVMFDAIQAFSR